MQFDKGDEIELTEFSESAYVCKNFTDNKADIFQAVDGMTAYGSTRLYDTLISEIERIQSRGNAKCVIGFTDGYDNVSVYSAQDVVNSAVAYNIPVFLIGIGSGCDASTLQYIAQSTGGFYQNINDLSSLESIYDFIYKQEKEVYLLEYNVVDPDNFEGVCRSDIYVRTQDGNGGYVRGFSFEPRDFFASMYNRFLIAGIDCQTRGERNLLDSGLIVTTPEAYGDESCVAHQSQASINSGGVGSRNSSIFEVLVYYDVLNVYKDGDGYVLYGVSNYNISKVRKFSSIKNDLEKKAIQDWYGDVGDPNQEFWIEENISNYEKLTLVKDTDGKWKFLTRVYEREDGNKAVTINTVYNVLRQ